MLVIQISEQDHKIAFNGKPITDLNPTEVKDLNWFLSTFKSDKDVKVHAPKEYIKSDAHTI